MDGASAVARGPGGRFRKRFLLFLKVGTRTVLPTKVHLHDRKNFAPADLEELIAMVEKHVVAKYVRRVAGRQGDLVFAEMKNTTKKEKQEFSARCTPFKRSSCVSSSLRFGYYFHEEPYGQPVVLTPLRETEESESVLIDLVEQEAIEKMLLDEMGVKEKEKRPSSTERDTPAGEVGGGIAALAPKLTQGVTRKQAKDSGNGDGDCDSGVDGEQKSSMRQLSLAELVQRKSGPPLQGDGAKRNAGDGDFTEGLAQIENASEEEDVLMSSQEELDLLLEVGKEDEPETIREKPSPAVATIAAAQPLSHLLDGPGGSSARMPAISLLAADDEAAADFLSSSPSVAALEEQERAVTIDMSGKGQRRWKEMRALPFTLMLFTRPNSGAPPTAASRSKAAAQPPPISISSYFGEAAHSPHAHQLSHSTPLATNDVTP